MSLIPRAQGNPYGNFQHMPAIASELGQLALMLLNQSGQNLGNPLNCHQSSLSSIIENVKNSYIPPLTFSTSIGSIKQETRPSNETQEQLISPNVQPDIDPISAQELNVSRELRNANLYSSQSISGQNSKGEPRNKTRRSKKGAPRKTISDKSDLSSVPSHIRDDQLHGSGAKVEGGQDNSGNNEDSSATLARWNFGGDLQVQPLEQHQVSAPKFESSKSPDGDGGRSVSSVPNQGCFSQFFEGLDWMTQNSYYQDPTNGIQSVCASENNFNSSADMPSTINGDTIEAFQNSCLSDCFPSSIQEFISSPELNSLTFLPPEIQNLDVQHDGSNLQSTSNSYIQMSFSEESGHQGASLSGLHMDAIHISTNNSSCSQPLTTGSFDAGAFSNLPNLKESQALPLQEIHNSSMGTPSCSMDATEYTIDRSMNLMNPPVRTYTKV
jgi:auxin response factor